MTSTLAAELAPTVAVKILSAGTAACVADLVTFPLDTAKVRLQIQGESKSINGSKRYKGVFGTIFTMVRSEGPRSLYSGLVAGLHRQMTFASVRIGLYDSMKQFYSRGSGGLPKTLHLLKTPQHQDNIARFPLNIDGLESCLSTNIMLDSRPVST